MPATPRRPRRPTTLYGLPLPSARHGVGSVAAVAGTGRLWTMAARFGPERLVDGSDLARITADVHANLERLEGLDAITGTGPGTGDGAP
ncbi:hypothetical protein [Vallicoccus soli]|uniref:hypothetical protein n=1 Tax=Vallicoccus soli TaxID=2339232 RepID=UPI0014040CB9|nr:hypothetical protein [Vallicoccus soli]